MGIDNEKSLSAAAELRHRAEMQLNAQMQEARPPRTEEESLRLVYELEVHQIELEMQNAELRQARDDVELLDRYTDLYDFAPIGYFTLDRNGTISAVNLSGATLLEVERSQLHGRHFGLFVPVNTRPIFSEFLGKVFASRGKESCEVTLTREGNQLLFVQLEAVAFESGQECRVAVIDITARRRAEEERERLLLQLEAVLESINEGVIISDLKGNVLSMNKEALALYEYENVEQVRRQLSEYQDTFELFDLEGRPVPFEQWPLSRALRGEHFTDREVRVRRKDTGKLWIGSYSGTQVRNKSGDFILSVNTVRDVTERKFAEEEIVRLNVSLAARAADLEDANRELEAFNYTVAHDLRNPLNVIGSYCQVFKELCGDKLDEQCRRYIQETYDGALRMNRLIEALLNFSRLAHAETRREMVDLAAMAHEVAAELKQAEPERRVTFLIADGASADGDAALLRVVLYNLIDNAWKYTTAREEGIIEFGMTEVDGKLAWFVRDNGNGFNMADADKLFTAFQRLPGSEESRGFGIGLSTVERIIKRHGGRIWAEGVPGKGATFYFTLSAN